MSRELLKRAAVVLREVWDNDDCYCAPSVIKLQKEIETYLAQPEPEPVAWALFSKELMPTGAAYAIRRVEIQLAQIESDLDIQDAKIRPLYTTPPDQSARIAEFEAKPGIGE